MSYVCVCEVCYGTSDGLHHVLDQHIEPDPEMLATMSEEDAVALANVQARYRRYRDMYTNCTVVNGNLEIVYLMGPGNETFSLDFLLNIREVTSRPQYILAFAAEPSKKSNR